MSCLPSLNQPHGRSNRSCHALGFCNSQPLPPALPPAMRPARSESTRSGTGRAAMAHPPSACPVRCSLSSPVSHARSTAAGSAGVPRTP